MKSKFTGERAVPDGTPRRIWDDHMARYIFAKELAQGRRVLDAACGAGYGAEALARAGAQTVDGLDIDAATIEAARKRYQSPGLRFHVGSVHELPFDEASFDLVVSFETLEHVPDPDRTVEELARVLRPRGTLLISTPNRPLTSPGRRREDKPENPYHVFELDKPELLSLLERRFEVLGVRGQRLLYSPLVRGPLAPLVRRRAPFLVSGSRGLARVTWIPPGFEPRYMIAVCHRK